MRIVIIGGGMSGMTCAITLAKNGHAVTLIEKNNRLGKKISMSGNGRCNISNINIDKAMYNNSPIVDNVLSANDNNDVMTFIDSIGLHTYADNMGRIYPLCDNANSVVDCMRYQLDRYSVDVHLESIVNDIVRLDSVVQYKVMTNNGEYSCDCVVLACGSGSGVSNVNLVQLVGQDNVTKLVPSLVPIATKNSDKTLNGIRTRVVAQLSYDNKVISSNTGEVLFKDYGLSGICIFELSSHIARGIKGGNDVSRYSIELDLLPTIDSTELLDILQQRLDTNVAQDKLLLGIMHNKLANHCINAIKGEFGISKLVNVIKHDHHSVAKLLGMEMSQVTVGGVRDSSIDDNLRMNNGVYVLGECLDVDGNCGGYNHHFAISSALYVSKVIGRI